MNISNNLKISLFGIGPGAYWPQFKGLRERLAGYLDEVDKRPGSCGAEIGNLGLIDNPVKAMKQVINSGRQMQI